MTGQEFIDKSDLCYYDTDAEAILYGFSYAKTKAYAAAQVAAKDAEIEGLKANLQGQVDARMRDRKSKKELSDMYIALKADKERTREGVATQVDRLHKLHNNSSTLSDDDCEWLRSIAKELKSLLSPADDTYDSGKFGAPNNLDRPSKDCTCSHTIDGRLAKQCDNCRNKPFAPADGDGVEVIWAGGMVYVNDALIGYFKSRDYFSYGCALGLGFGAGDTTTDGERKAKAEAMAVKWYTDHKDEMV